MAPIQSADAKIHHIIATVRQVVLFFYIRHRPESLPPGPLFYRSCGPRATVASLLWYHTVATTASAASAAIATIATIAIAIATAAFIVLVGRLQQRTVMGRQVHHGWLLVKMGGVYFSDILLNR